MVGVGEQRDGGGCGSWAVTGPTVRCGYCLCATCCSVCLATVSDVCIGAYCGTDQGESEVVYEWEFPYFRLFSLFCPDFLADVLGLLLAAR